MPSAHPRIQVTIDPELAAAIDEVAEQGPRSRAVRDLAVRGAEALRAERERRDEAIRFLAEGLDPKRYDLAVAARLHERR